MSDPETTEAELLALRESEARYRMLFDRNPHPTWVNDRETQEFIARKQAETALRASEERFRKQYKGIPLPTYSWLQVRDMA